jgi:hypothetical protein
MARPKNAVPHTVLSVRVPVRALEKFRAAVSSGMKVGKFMEQILERGLAPEQPVAEPQVQNEVEVEDGDRLLTEEEVLQLCAEEGLTSAQIEEAKKSLGFGDAGEDVVLGDRVQGDLIRVVELLNKIIKHYAAEDRPAIAQFYLNRIAADLQRNLESTKEFVEALRNGEPWAVNAREVARAAPRPGRS